MAEERKKWYVQRPMKIFLDKALLQLFALQGKTLILTGAWEILLILNGSFLVSFNLFQSFITPYRASGKLGN